MRGRLLWGLLGLLLASLPARAQTVYAVLVGVSSYGNQAGKPAGNQLPSTAHAKPSVTLLAGALRWAFPEGANRNLQLTFLIDQDIPDAHAAPTTQNVLEALKAVEKKAAPEDTVLFYFTGHGIYQPGVGQWLLMTGSKGLVPDSDNLALSKVAEALREIKAEHKLVFIEACRTDDPNAGTLPTEQDFYADEALALTPWGDAVVYYAASKGQEAHIDAKGLGFFTEAVAGGLLARADGIHGGARDYELYFHELKTYVDGRVTNRVREERNGAIQEPRAQSSIGVEGLLLASFKPHLSQGASFALEDGLGPSSFGLSTGTLLDAQRPEDWFNGVRAYQRTDRDWRAPVSTEMEWLALRRRYRSDQTDNEGLFGLGWTSSLEARIDIKDSHPCKLVLRSSTGSRYDFIPALGCPHATKALVRACPRLGHTARSLQKVSLATLFKEPGVLQCFQNLVYKQKDIPGADLRITESEVRITVGNQASYLFNRQGRLTHVLQSGNRFFLNLSYLLDGRLWRVTTQNSELHFNYTDNGLVDSITEGPDVLRYTYDPQLRLTGVSVEGRVLFTYSYDDQNRLVGVSAFHGDEPYALTVGYDAAGRRQSLETGNQQLTWSYEPSGEVLLAAGPRGSPANRHLRAAWSDSELRFTDQERQRERRYKLLACCALTPQWVKVTAFRRTTQVNYRYNLSGLLTEARSTNQAVTLTWDTERGQVSSFQLTQNGKIQTRSQYCYDEQGRLQKVRDNPGGRLTLTYDKRGRLSLLHDYEGPGSGDEPLAFHYAPDQSLEKVTYRGLKVFPLGKNEERPAQEGPGSISADDVNELVTAMAHLGGIDKYLVPAWEYIDTMFQLLEGDALWHPDAVTIHQQRHSALLNFE
ncbi:caspase family protein [Archangium sp.]|uniref:caspase family protein n=1 Tax=Archangium sp. TaxID=1872627 RepID=UPI002D4603C7|nr:caspase family protein [Archangium sp.]HYO58133.1 caspase family protein [Archangium sp.]